MESKLEQLFYFALGSALAAKEKFEKSSEEAKVWQEKAEQNARTFFDDLAQRGEQEKDAFRSLLKDLLKEIVSELDLATKADLEQLKKDLGR
jgi:polyhydroxyalkanoate synthesis regulator phasin